MSNQIAFKISRTKFNAGGGNRRSIQQIFLSNRDLSDCQNQIMRQNTKGLKLKRKTELLWKLAPKSNLPNKNRLRALNFIAHAEQMDQIPESAIPFLLSLSLNASIPCDSIIIYYSKFRRR